MRATHTTGHMTHMLLCLRPLRWPPEEYGQDGPITDAD
jgi:hypothetical protein